MQVLKGSFVAIVTPMFEDGNIDFQSLKSLVNWHIKAKTTGIVFVGTTGESSTLNFYEHLDVIKAGVNYAKNELIVIAGTGANSTSEAIDLATESENIGANFSLTVTPYYNKPSQNGLIKHYESIAASSSIKHILYNVPSRTACDLLPSSVKELMLVPNIVGIKEAGNSLDRIKELVQISKNIEDFDILSGDDNSFLDAMKMGASGVISVAANIIPREISSICSHALNGLIPEAEKKNEIYKDLYDLLFIESNPIPVKWSLYKMKKVSNSIRLPLTSLDKSFQKRLLSELVKVKIL